MPKSLLRSLMAVATILGTGLQAAQSQAPQPLSMPGYPTIGSPAIVTLTSPGNAPRVPIRLKVQPGQKETMLLTMGMGLTMSVEGMEGMALPPQNLPLMKMWADTAVTAVAPNGDITYDIGFTRLAVETEPGGDPSIAQMIQAAAGEITALKGTMTVSSRGINKSAAIDVNKIQDPAMRQTLGQMSGQFESLSMPMPEEPVGVGAKWEVRQAINSAGAQMFQRVECELTALDATGATIKVKSEQTAPPQSISNPALAGMTMNIEKVAGGGSGTIELKFASLTPSSSMDSATAMTVAMDMGGQTQRLAMKVSLKMTVGPEKK